MKIYLLVMLMSALLMAIRFIAVPEQQSNSPQLPLFANKHLRRLHL